MAIKDLFPYGLNMSEAYKFLEPVALYILGMSVYAIFVFAFSRFLATKDIFKFDISRYEESKHRAVRVVLHTVLYVAYMWRNTYLYSRW